MPDLQQTIAATLVAFGFAAAAPVIAQTEKYPTKPVRIVVGFPQ